MRGYDEAVDVGADADGAPAHFEWRGRRYRVTQVLDTWRERVPWWRLALDPDASQAPLEPEQRAWRVEAAAGRLSSSGVFHLVCHGGRWSLRALTD